VSAILAFDTSGETMHLGLLIGAQAWAHESAGGARASAELLSAIWALLGRAGASLADLDAIAFGCGPGAFTGLRTACSVAQGLALGASKPVLAIDTLMAIAEDARRGAAHLQMWATVDARMEQIYAAQYLYQRGHWKVLDAPMLASVDVLNQMWKEAPPQHIAGNALAVFAGRLECASARCHRLAAPRAAPLLALAKTHWEQGAVLDAGAAMPSYVRHKVAQTLAERAAARRLGEGSCGPAA
jgi:tRNA threonylcarbamoyladenosine biosynthesis protein TsaB